MSPKTSNGAAPNDSFNKSDKGRRTFLKTACGITGGLMMTGGIPNILPGRTSEEKPDAAPSPEAMPKIRIGNYEVSRLVLGANPIWGYSYQGKLMGKFMVNYFNDDNIVKLFHQAEQSGINTFQTSFPKRFPNVWKRYLDEGGKMNLIILYSPNEITVKEAATYKPMAIVHHGGVTDNYWRNNKFQLVHDFVKEVKDAGVLAGVSCHEPDVIDKITQEDWEHDLFMACFYEMTRPADEWNKMLGFKPILDVFSPNDPVRMCQSIRQTKKPCLGFKILAGGWAAGRPEQTEQTFKFAFQNIKPSDGVIVGMLPVFDDQVSENAKCTIKYGQGV